MFRNERRPLANGAALDNHSARSKKIFQTRTMRLRRIFDSYRTTRERSKRSYGSYPRENFVVERQKFVPSPDLKGATDNEERTNGNEFPGRPLPAVAEGSEMN